MINELEIENFKPFSQAQKIKLAPVTLIYGPNSGGKSSIIQSLLLLRQTLEKPQDDTRPLVVRGDFVDLGSFKSLVHKHDLSRDVRLSVNFSGKFMRRQPYLRQHLLLGANRDSFRTVDLRYGATKTKGSRKKNSSDLMEVRYTLGGPDGFSVGIKKITKNKARPTQLFLAPSMENISAYEWIGPNDLDSFRQMCRNEQRDDLEKIKRRLETIRRRRETALAATKPGNTKRKAARAKRPLERDEYSRTSEIRYLETRLKRENSQLEAMEQYLASLGDATVMAYGPLPVHVMPNSEDKAEEQIRLRRHTGGGALEGIAFEFGELIQSIRYLGPLRSYPERHYLVMGAGAETVGRSGEHTPQLLHRRGNDAKKRTNYWFDHFNIPYELRTKLVGDEVIGEILAISLVDQRTKVAVSPTDVGFGVGQLLPILVEGIVAKNSIICVEQPEIHLHPRLQAHVADFLIETSGAGKRTSRSKSQGRNQWIIETHSEALMLRLQRRVREGEISNDDVAVIYVEPSAEGTRVQQLRLDDSGEFIDEWPGGFFEESYDELIGSS